MQSSRLPRDASGFYQKRQGRSDNAQLCPNHPGTPLNGHGWPCIDTTRQPHISGQVKQHQTIDVASGPLLEAIGKYSLL